MMRLVLRGGLAGFIATIPMTALMLYLRRLLPREREMPLAPVEVAEGAMDAAGVEEAVPNEAKPPTHLLAHLGYGTSAGVIYQLLVAPTNLPRMSSGMVFGFAVWAGSYLGYLPALGIRRSAKEDPWERNFTMIASHLTWGAVLGLLAARPRDADTAQHD